MTRITIPVTELRPGDRWSDERDGVHYTIEQKLLSETALEVEYRVRYRDGGTSIRVWPCDETITVERDR